MSQWTKLEESLPRVVRRHSDEGKGVVEYVPPPWADFDTNEVLDKNAECYSLEIISHGTLLENVKLFDKPYYVLGSLDDCQLVYKNPLVSRRHLVFQLNRHGGLMLFDLKSTHGTTVNHMQIKPETYYLLRAGDQVRVGKRGSTSRTYIVCGPEHVLSQEETEELPKRKKVAKDSTKEDERIIMEAVKKATAADYYDTSLGFDEYDSYFDSGEKTDDKGAKRKQKTHTSTSLKVDLNRLYQEEVEALNRWYAVLASAIDADIISSSQKMSKTDKQLKNIQLKGFNEDKLKLQNQLDNIRSEIERHKRLLRLTRS
ncbi:hypothetical protein BgAZ_106420 [Babesia gibsoni]|uniref:FHA domain-containing protein n=1 Tax=Babesia gibsoni TaxID=33632 RepID=A0AAD8PG67_BABGI|nr:hypothetical protein BgAZ_106420 [Babesia gibsoni]